MRSFGFRCVSALTAATVLLASTAAFAQGAEPQPQAPIVQAPPPGSIAPNGQFVAPLQQQTQPSYVPQSVALSGPRVITDWDEDAPIPHGYHEETRVRKGFIIGGAITFGTMCLITAIGAAAALDGCKSFGRTPCGEHGVLFIPVAGPFIDMAYVGDSTAAKVMLAIDGVAQAAGLGMFILGLAWQKNVLVRNDLGFDKPKTYFGPMAVGSGNGIGFLKTF
jgi:hypothetical protein